MVSAREFIEENLVIRTKDARIVPLRLNPAQERLYAALETQRAAGRPMRVIILKARQLGYSTLGEMLTFQYNDSRRPEAMPGEHDDLVMALAIAHGVRGQQDCMERPDPPGRRSGPGICWRTGSMPMRREVACWCACGASRRLANTSDTSLREIKSLLLEETVPSASEADEVECGRLSV